MAEQNLPETSPELVQLVNQKPKLSLHHAARDNREDVVQQWIKFLSGTDAKKLNKKDSFGFAPIHYAAKFNRYSIVVSLVEAGADPNITTTEEGLTPLHFAARYTPRIIDKDIQLQESTAHESEGTVTVGKLSTSVATMIYLIQLKGEKSVKVNVKAQYGVSALHLASQRGNEYAVDILLRKSEIIVNIQDENRDTPLHEACLNGHYAIVEKLLLRMKLENPEDVNISLQNVELQSPLHIACREGYTEIVKILLQQVSSFQNRANLTQTRDNEQNTALHLACESGKEEIVRILLLNGADLFAVKIEDVTPMHIAARYGFTEEIKTLMSSGEDIIDVVDIYNRTPLHYAAAHNQVDMINFLIDHKADITATDSESFTPLMLAAEAGHMDAFHILILRGSSIDEADENGKTVLHHAAEKNHVDVLRFILKDKSGAMLINSTDSSNSTPLHLAAQEGNVDSVEMLINLAKSIKIDAKNELNKTPIHLAATRGHVHIIRALLNHQKDCILDEDEDGNTPLHLASINGYHKSVKVLLDAQADFDAKNANLWTPIDCAAHGGHDKVVDVLITAGADVNPTDKLQTTPLHLASQEGHLSVVNILLKHNAEAGKCTNKLNALDIAIDNGHEDIALALIKSKQWKKTLRNTTVNQFGNCTTPLRKLIKKMPEVAEEVFNRCSTAKNATESTDYSVTFDYEFLEDFQDAEENFIIRSMKNRRANEVASDSGDADGASVDPYETKTKLNDDGDVESYSKKKHNFTTHWGPIGFKKNLHPLTVMVANNRTDLLKHPLVTSLLKLKWTTYGRQAYFFNLFIYIIFVIFITSFALLSLNPQSSTCIAEGDKTFGNVSKISLMMYRNDSNGCVAETSNSSSDIFTGAEVCINDDLRGRCDVSLVNCGQCGLSSVRRAFLYTFASVVIVVAFIRLIFELFQFFNLKIYYIFDWVNWIEVTLFVSAIAFVFVYSSPCLCPARWQWQLGCVAVFLTWIDLIIFIRKIPLTGIYVLMFVHIFYTFCKMIILTMLLILAFSIAFYMAFFDPSENFSRSSFATPGRALIKTMTMTTGEFEFDSIFRQFPGGSDSGTMTEEIPFPPVSFLLWIIFLVLMPILLTNLLVGLAVDDIKGIQEAAVLKRLALQVELALSVEELLPQRVRRWFIKGKFTVLPNRKLNMVEKIRYEIFGAEDRYDSPDNISNALHPQPTPIEQVQSQNRSLSHSLKKMSDTINELNERNIAMEKLIQEMARKQVPGVVEERSFI